MQVNFVKKNIGKLMDKKILDIGCATGELAYKLAVEKALVTGIDLNEDLIVQAKEGAVSQSAGMVIPDFRIGNMLEIVKDFGNENFDAVLCFGNTLVHLLSLNLIRKFTSGVYNVLKPEGIFLLQILNYDFILEEKVEELPLIETENIRFIRKYKLEENNPLIRFKTALEIKKEKQIVSNETSLLALKSSQLYKILEASGFREIKFFSNYKQDAFCGKHLPLIVSCKK